MMQNVSELLTESMRILIVEDDASLASGVSRILESEGYAVDATSRGEEAVEAAKRERFDLVILDIGLPGMDGFEALRRPGGGEHRGPVLVLAARRTGGHPGDRLGL